MGKGDIRLHPKHGLNPTMPICFWCGEDKGEIALLGAAYKEEAPMRMLLDYNPCKKCEDTMALGIMAFEIIPASEASTPSMAKEGSLSAIAPTGRWSVIREEYLDKILKDEASVKQALEARKMALTKDVYEMLGLHRKPEEYEG